MKIAHVVTYVSASGDFGGPVAVAMELANQQSRDGHDVTLFAAWDGVVDLPTAEIRYALIRAWRPTASLRGIMAPHLLFRLWRDCPNFDVVHVHMGRDLVSTPAALVALGRGVATVIQPHGMIQRDSRLSARIFDSILTRRALSRARRVLALTQTERSNLEIVSAGRASIREVPNGVSAAVESRTRDRRQVIFMARLSPRKRPRAFVAVAAILAARVPDASFVIVGPDEGELAGLLDGHPTLVAEGRLRYEGALPHGQGVRRLSEAGIYVLPSVGEVFPMAVLEAMAAGTPSVITSDCGLAKLVEREGAALVADVDVASIADQVEALLLDDGLYNKTKNAALRLVRTELGIESVSRRITSLYGPDT